MIRFKRLLKWPLLGKVRFQIYYQLFNYVCDVAKLVLITNMINFLNIKVNIKAIFYKKSVGALVNQLKAFKVLSFFSSSFPAFKFRKAYTKRHLMCVVSLLGGFSLRFFGFLCFLAKQNEEVFLALKNVIVGDSGSFCVVLREAGMYMDLGFFGLDFFNWFVPLIVEGEVKMLCVNKMVLLDKQFVKVILSVLKVYLLKR